MADRDLPPVVIEIRSLLVGAALGIALAVPAVFAGTLAWHAGKQLEREGQSLALALGCGPTAELEVITRHGVGVVKCKTAARAGGTGD